MSALCDCGAKRNHAIHVVALGMPGAHAYRDPSKAGLSQIGKARERFNESEAGRAYNATTRALAAGETACQIQSPVCTGIAQHQDEALPRGRAGGLGAALRDGPAPYLACDRCNSYLAENLTWASEHGFARLKAPPASNRRRSRQSVPATDKQEATQRGGD